jgi:hypothetical protein
MEALEDCGLSATLAPMTSSRLLHYPCRTPEQPPPTIDPTSQKNKWGPSNLSELREQLLPNLGQQPKKKTNWPISNLHLRAFAISQLHDCATSFHATVTQPQMSTPSHISNCHDEGVGLCLFEMSHQTASGSRDEALDAPLDVVLPSSQLQNQLRRVRCTIERPATRPPK